MIDDMAAIGWTTTSTSEEAVSISNELLKAGLVACAQISAPIQSHYVWKGKPACEKEYRVTLKFLDHHALAIETWLRENHSYDVPQWIWIRSSGCSSDYLKWMNEG